MKNDRLSTDRIVSSVVVEGSTRKEMTMKLAIYRKTQNVKSLVLLTLALGSYAVANAETAAAKVAPREVLQVVRMEAQSVDADLELMAAFNLCTDSIKKAAGAATLDSCVTALKMTRDSAIRLTSATVLIGNVNRAALNQNVAAAYSNAAVASWQVGDIRASRSYMQHAMALAPSASFVRVNAPRLAGIPADGASLASN
jgi:hypothetical protein